MRLGLALGSGFQSALNTFGTVNDLADKMDERDADKRVRDAVQNAPREGAEITAPDGTTRRATARDRSDAIASAMESGGRTRDVVAAQTYRASGLQMDRSQMEVNRLRTQDSLLQAARLARQGDFEGATRLAIPAYNGGIPDGGQVNSFRMENGLPVLVTPGGERRFASPDQAVSFVEGLLDLTTPETYAALMQRRLTEREGDANRTVTREGQRLQASVGMAGVAATREGIAAADRRQTENLRFQGAEAALGRIFTADENALSRSQQTALQGQSQQFQRDENAANRTFQMGLQGQSQQFQRDENAANRTFQRDERLGNQEFQRGENNDNRALTARGLGIQGQQAETQARVAEATIPLTQEQTRAARRGNEVAEQVQATINEFSAIARIPPNRRTPEQQDRALALASDIGTRDAGRLRVVKIKDADGTEREVLVNPFEHIANSGVSAQLMQFRREMEAATPEQRPSIINAVRREIGVERYNRDFLPAVIDYVMPPPAPPQSGQRGQRGQGSQGGQGVQGGLPVSPQVRSAYGQPQAPTTPGLMSPPDLERWLTLNPPAPLR